MFPQGAEAKCNARVADNTSRMQSRVGLQMILSGLRGELQNHRSAALGSVKHSKYTVCTHFPLVPTINHHLFIASEVEAAWTQQCKYQLS